MRYGGGGSCIFVAVRKKTMLHIRCVYICIFKNYSIHAISNYKALLRLYSCKFYAIMKHACRRCIYIYIYVRIYIYIHTHMYIEITYIIIFLLRLYQGAFKALLRR